jgi:dienelactone hydrolase
MKYVVAFLLATINFCGAFAQVGFDAKARAKECIYLFRQEKFETLYQRMDKDMQRLLDVEKLEGFWYSLEMQMGAVKEVGEPQVTDRDSLIITVTPIQFEKNKFGFKLVFDKVGKISGMYLEPATQKYTPASYVDASLFYEIKKTLPDPKYPVEGMLTIPNRGRPFPVVIIAAGSGPSDKDLTMGPNRIYKDLAWGLANHGVATFRFDKRTKTYGTQMSKLKNLTVKEEYLEDLKLAIQVVKKNPEIDSTRIYILGHSEGGYLIPYFEKNLKGLAGYISFAGSYSDLAPLLLDQLYYLQTLAPAGEKKDYDELIQQTIYCRDKLTKDSPADSLPLGMEAAYILHLNQNSPSKLAVGLNQKKLLFLQGERDYQVPKSELFLWQNALKNNPNASFELYPKLNHLGLEGDKASVPSEYEVAGNIPEYVIKRIARFVLY